jgi:hypothetical protein
MKLTTEQFISKSQKIHGDKFDYSQSIYEGSAIKLIIICRIHGTFSQTPSEHYIGKGGCPKCHSEILKTMHLSNKDEFVKKARIKLGNKFEYIGEYIDQHTRMLIKCNEHNEDFYMTPKTHLRGCSNCSGCLLIRQHEKNLRNSMSSDSFLMKAREVHNHKYEYSPIISEYVKTLDVVEVTCNEHGSFKIRANKHLAGQGCVPCSYISTANFQRSNKDEFINKAIEVHGLKYDYSNFEYTSAQTKSKIICPTHGPFQMHANNHLSGCGCRPCSGKGFSAISVRWLQFEARSRGIFIQHALNGGEFNIPDSKFRVDGFSKPNLIFEFHGDYFHGNPNIYKPNVINYLNKKTMGELYERTLSRENEIRRLGYTTVIMWENTWRTVEKASRKWKELLKTPKPKAH